MVKKILNLIKDIFLFYFLGSVNYAKKKGVKIGDNCRIYIKNWGSEPFLISIGDNVTITSGVRIVTHDGSTCLVKDSNNSRYFYYAPVEIGSNVFIGLNSIIMPGVKIGDNVIIGAGSVVTKNIPDNSVFAGNPAKYICSFDDYKNKVIKKYIKLGNCGKTYKEKVFHAIKLMEEKNGK